MLTLNLDSTLPQPLYEQLYLGILEAITSATLSTNERLPSKRAIAQHLSVSVVTVESAYSQLVAEGYLRAEPKRGFFVQPLYNDLVSPVKSVVSPLVSEPVQENPFLYDFTTNAVDTAKFPFATWAKLMREVLTQEDSKLLASSHPQGLLPLRQAIVQHLQAFRGISVSPEQVIVGAGSEYLTGLLVQLLGREAPYGVEDPGYLKIARILTSNGCQVSPIPLDEQGLDLNALSDSGAQVVHVTPSHHFPLGTVMSPARRRALLHWAYQEKGRYIIEDDYDSEFRFAGRPIPALQSLDAGERVIYLNTFTKSLAPSLRISYLVLPPHLLERYQQELAFYASTVPSFEQHALTLFMERGHLKRHISRMNTLYKGRRDALLSAVELAGLSPYLSHAGSEAGQQLILTVNLNHTEQQLVSLAESVAVKLYPLSNYYHHSPTHSQPSLVMGYARLGSEEMLPAFLRLKQAWLPSKS